MTLFQMIHREQDAEDLDTRLRRSLDLTSSVHDIPACKALQTELENQPTTSLLDRFTREALPHLWLWHRSDIMLSKLSPIPPTSLATIEGYRSEEYIDDDEEPTEDLFQEDPGNISTKNDSLQFCMVLADLAAKRIPTPKTFDCYQGPTTGALTGFSLAACGVIAWYPGPQTPMHETMLAKAPKSARAVTHTTLQDSECMVSVRGPANRENTEKVFEQSIKHLQEVMSSRNDVGKRHFEEVCTRLCSQTARPASVETLAGNAMIFGKLDTEVRDDNWYHCRKLIQLLTEFGKCSVSDATQHETCLMLVPAAVEAGTSEPLPWLIVLDGALKQVWRWVKYSGDKDKFRVLKLVMEDLVVFAHGTAVNSIACRFERHRLNPQFTLVNQPSDLVRWYAMLFKVDPWCANSQCFQLLPGPSELTGASIRDVFSFGTREARVGHPAIHKFISENRKFGYPCLANLLGFRQPHSVLVALLYWYSHVFHLHGCRPMRGKWAMNFA
jgi:hypothetical protein